MNHKNENRILAYGFATGILVLGIGTSAIILNHEIQNANRAINFNSKNYLVFRQENLDSAFNFQVLAWETAQENQPQNPKTETEIQNLAFPLSDQDRYTICCIVYTIYSIIFFGYTRKYGRDKCFIFNTKIVGNYQLFAYRYYKYFTRNK